MRCCSTLKITLRIWQMKNFVATMTDDGCNFIKVFKEFHICVTDEENNVTEEDGLSFITIDSSSEVVTESRP